MRHGGEEERDPVQGTVRSLGRRVRQLRGPQVRTWAWWSKRSSIAVTGAETWEGQAVVLSGAEREALFAAVVKATPTFGLYQEGTQRTIPVVELLPAK